MTARRIGDTLRGVLLLRESKASAGSDRILLERYLATRDEDAFATLVVRHGRLVLGVCRSVLRQEQDAEDAFQATFLVLARRAAAIRKQDSLASWLYGVALRTATKARKALARRHQREQHAGTRSADQPVTEAALHELQRILHEETERLPEKYRAPFVLCCLEGRSRADAAHELGWKEGTVSGRIAQARALLESRLARRGIGLSAALTAAALAPTAADAVPVGLYALVARAGFACSVNPTGPASSPEAAALAEDVVRSMVLTKTRVVLGLVLAAVLVGLGSLLAYTQAPEGEPDRVPPRHRTVAESGDPPVNDHADKPAPDPAMSPASGAPSVKLMRRMSAFPIDTGGRLNALASAEHRPVVFSPDSKRIAFGEYRYVDKVGYVHTLHVQETATGKELWKREGRFRAAAFTPDQSILAVAYENRIHLLASATGKEIRSLTIQKKEPLVNFEVPGGDRAALLRLSTPDIHALAFSSDGKTLAVASLETNHFLPTDIDLSKIVPQFDLWDVATGKELHQRRGPGGTSYRLVGFAPDGKILAWEDYHMQSLERLVDLQTGTVLLSVRQHDRHVQSAVVSPDARMCIWGGTKYEDYSIKQWDLARNQEVRRLKVRRGTVNDLVFSSDGAFFVSNTGDGLKSWDTATGAERQHFRGSEQRIDDIALSPDGKLLATGGLDGTVLLWDVATGKLLEQLLKDKGWIRSVSFSPDGKVLVAGRDGVGEKGQSESEAILWSLDQPEKKN
jgi:RNA polymerase sigma factor (sigma-70 family)